MTSLRQIEANRLNSLKSTGPTSEYGKKRSRRNAIRHGLTAETVIDVLEDPEDYKAFEAAVIADYEAPTAIERELALRLASLLWRLRRATTIETGLLNIQAEILREAKRMRNTIPRPRERIFESMVRLSPSAHRDAPAIQRSQHEPNSHYFDEDAPNHDQTSALKPKSEIAHCFLRVANLDSGAFERLNRYEVTLWRQVGQILFTLEAVGRKNRNERTSRAATPRRISWPPSTRI